MDKLEINGETWGRVMMGKQGTTATYRKSVDGKMIPVRKHEVPQDVIEAFDGFGIEEVGEPTFEEMKEVADIIGDENIGGESRRVKPAGDVHENDKSVDIQKEDVNDFGFDGKAPEVDWQSMYNEAVQNDAEHLSLKELCNILYSRFGVYTCYLQREPKQDDVHPITGNLMNNFTRGQARQQYLSAVAAKTNYDPNVMARILKSRESHFDMQAHRDAHPERFVSPDIEMPEEDNPYADKKLTMKEWRDMRAAEKPIMNSERGRRGDGTDEDELYAEPPINGHTIIRPYATNPIAERRLAEKRALRERGY